jgi:hypothetical protein
VLSGRCFSQPIHWLSSILAMIAAETLINTTIIDALVRLA